MNYHNKKYLFEFTDKQINIFDVNKNKVFGYLIPEGLIKDNKIIDIIKLKKEIIKIVNKYKIVNNFIKSNIIILTFIKPDKINNYLYYELFNSMENLNVKVKYVFDYLDNNAIVISGKNIYYKKGKVKDVNSLDGRYILYGNSDNFEKLKSKLLLNKKIKLLEFEDQKTILYNHLI